MNTFLTWKEARDGAEVLATKYQISYGLEAVTYFGKKQFSIFMLPSPEKRYGRELRCEVVEPCNR